VRITPLLIALAVLAGASACNKSDSKTASATPAADSATPAKQEPAKPFPAQLPDVLVRVDGDEVKKSDFDLLIKNIELRRGPVPVEQRDEVFRGMLDQLITYKVLQHEAAKRNISATDAEVDDRLKGLRAQFPNDDEFKKALAARNMSEDRLRADSRVEIAIGKLLEGEAAALPGVTEADAKAFYDKNPDKFKQDESVRASHVLLLVDEKADEATKKKTRAEIDAILKRARAGEDFAALAKAHSKDGSAAQGGDLGFFGKGRMVPEFEQAAFALKPGEISDVVTTQFGYHIIKLTERKPSSTVPLETVNAQVKQFLTEQKKKERVDEFIKSLKDKSRIEVLV
jgi:peptidyl-prolyl cis-trans isomerase C